MTSCQLPPVKVTASGVLCRSTIRWCLEPGRARSTGEGPTWSPFEGPDMRSVYGVVVQAQQVGTAQLGQQGGVQAWPDAGPGPVPQSAPGRYAGRAHGLRRDVPPGNTGPQHEQDPASAVRSGTRNRPGCRWRRSGAGGSNGGHPLPQVPEQDHHTLGHAADQDRPAQGPGVATFYMWHHSQAGQLRCSTGSMPRDALPFSGTYGPSHDLVPVW